MSTVPSRRSASSLAVGGEGRLIAADARDTMAMARTIMADLQGRIPTIAGRLESILTDVNVTSRRLNEILTPENQQKILGMIDNLNAATQKFDTVLITMNSILKDIDDLVLDSEGDLAVTMKESRYIVESIARNIDAYQPEYGWRRAQPLRIQPPDPAEPGFAARRHVT